MPHLVAGDFRCCVFHAIPLKPFGVCAKIENLTSGTCVAKLEARETERKMKAVIQTVVLGFFAFASLGNAESKSPVSHTIDAQKSGIVQRPEGKWDISRYAEFLGVAFERPKAALERHYQAELPVALQNVVKEKDETKLSEIIADLMSHRNNAQKAEVVKMAQSVRDSKEKEETTDAAAIAFMDRLIWAGKGLLGETVPKDEKNEAFLGAFFGDEKDPKNQGAFADRMLKNQRISDAMKKATDPNSTQADKKAAKELLRGELTRDEAMAFIESQLKGGNKNQALAVTDAIAWTDPSGEKFLEFFRNGKSERLYLGPNQKTMEKALKTYSEKRGGLHGATLAEKEHTTSVPTELVATSKGELLENKRPQGVKPPPMLRAQDTNRAASTASSGGAPTKTRVPVQQVSTQKVNAQPKPAATASGGNGASTNSVATNPSSNGAALYQARCTGCHGHPKNNPPKEIDQIRTGAMPPQSNPSDPRAKPLTPAEKSAIIGYLSKR